MTEQFVIGQKILACFSKVDHNLFSS